MCWRAHMHTRARAHTHTHTCARTHTYTHVRAHTHTTHALLKLALSMQDTCSCVPALLPGGCGLETGSFLRCTNNPHPFSPLRKPRTPKLSPAVTPVVAAVSAASHSPVARSDCLFNGPFCWHFASVLSLAVARTYSITPRHP